jgi:hypothetical protein
LPQRNIQNARRLRRRQQASSSQESAMEFAAVVLFGSVVLWFVEEATDEHF